MKHKVWRPWFDDLFAVYFDLLGYKILVRALDPLAIIALPKDGQHDRIALQIIFWFRFYF